jgi:hypothetical protein
VAEAKLIELARGPAHTGRARWSMSLFKGKVVESNFIERTNDHPLGRALKRSNLEPHIEQQMVMRPLIDFQQVLHVGDEARVKRKWLYTQCQRLRTLGD